MPPPPPSAAVNRACLCKFSHSVAHGEGCATLPGKMGFLDLAGGRRFAPSGALSLKGWQDGGGGGGFRRRVDGEAAGVKAQVLTRQRLLVRDPEVLPLEEAAASAKTLNGNGACRRGKPLGFPEQAVATKMVVAVDVDEVLGSFLAALNKFIAERYSWNHSVSEYHVYEFFRDAIKSHTLEWIEKYYPGLFEQIHFGNHFALEGQSRPKSEICRSFGAQVLIDDNPRYAMECANDGMRVLLFDYDNSYPWCKTGVDKLHPLVTKVHNWEEVKEKLLSWVVPES
ncbi:hypothetical protein BAE44_0018059 [Dichanthelium oligosanthes]|uniref:Tac7077 n=1 Tax=Dichanthelium oligosanthes TaxID=888268 RepID=A0A1E5V722_9POAL|nr:hypothetical protein BAE44_0018059 [Dichanthelium oligosanthes]